MDLTNIPKSFWHSLSFAVVVATLGLVVIAYRASSVSIEIADAKIQLISAISETRDFKSALEEENQRLKKAGAELQQKIQALEQMLAPEKMRILKPEELKALEARPGDLGKGIISPEKFKEFDKRIEVLQQNLKK